MLKKTKTRFQAFSILNNKKKTFLKPLYIEKIENSFLRVLFMFEKSKAHFFKVYKLTFLKRFLNLQQLKNLFESFFTFKK